jgi:hypothetical protein
MSVQCKAGCRHWSGEANFHDQATEGVEQMVQQLMWRDGGAGAFRLHHHHLQQPHPILDAALLALHAKEDGPCE